MYEKQRDGFYYEVRDGMCVGRPLTEQEMQHRMMEQGVRHFHDRGSCWHTAGEQAAEGAITYLGIDTASQDAFNLRAAFAATARSLHNLERGL